MIQTKEKIIYLQKAIDDVTGKKIHFALFQGQLLQSCFDRSTEVLHQTSKEVKIKKRWALSLCRLYNQLAYCTVSIRFIRYSFKAIEENCKYEPDNWK